MENSIVLGVDIGGSHITAAQVHLKKRKIIEGTLTREYVDTKDKANNILGAWIRVINGASSASPLPLKKIGIAMPGPFDYDAGISLMKGQDKFDDLYALNIKALLATGVNTDRKYIRFMNDAECFLRGEVFSGAASGYHRAIGLSLGTGLGSAISENGTCRDADLWRSAFRGGIAEDYLSTRWFIRRFEELTGKKVKDVKELAGLHGSETAVAEVFHEFGANLGIFLSDFIRTSHAEVVVIGGNIAKAYPLFSGALLPVIAETNPLVEVKPALLGEEAALIGAASCWHQEAAIFNH